MGGCARTATRDGRKRCQETHWLFSTKRRRDQHSFLKTWTVKTSSVSPHYQCNLEKQAPHNPLSSHPLWELLASVCNKVPRATRSKQQPTRACPWAGETFPGTPPHCASCVCALAPAGGCPTSPEGGLEVHSVSQPLPFHGHCRWNATDVQSQFCK